MLYGGIWKIILKLSPNTHLICFTDDRAQISIPDELKTMMGADTVKIGAGRIFDMFQYQSLNRRLVYVCLEGVIETLFPQNKFKEVFKKLHSKSSRLKVVHNDKTVKDRNMKKRSWLSQDSEKQIRATTWQNQQNDLCAQGRLRSVWSESLLCTQCVAKDPRFLHVDNEDSDQTGQMPRLIWVFAGRTLILLDLSCRGSYSEVLKTAVNILKFQQSGFTIELYDQKLQTEWQTV